MIPVIVARMIGIAAISQLNITAVLFTGTKREHQAKRPPLTVYKQSKKYEQGRTCCYAGSEKKLLRTAVKSMQSFGDFSVSVIKAKQNVCRVSMRFQCILERRYLSVLQNVCKEKRHFDYYSSFLAEKC